MSTFITPRASKATSARSHHTVLCARSKKSERDRREGTRGNQRPVLFQHNRQPVHRPTFDWPWPSLSDSDRGAGPCPPSATPSRSISFDLRRGRAQPTPAEPSKAPPNGRGTTTKYQVSQPRAGEVGMPAEMPSPTLSGSRARRSFRPSCRKAHRNEGRWTTAELSTDEDRSPPMAWPRSSTTHSLSPAIGIE